MNEPVLHVSALVVRCRAERTEEVAAAVASLPGAEVHARDNGRMAVVLEGPDEHFLAHTANTLSLMQHVYSATIVSHEIERGAPHSPARDGDPHSPEDIQEQP